jgi:hydroxyacylglutathione hydrolase
MSSRAKICRLADPAPLEDDLSYVWRKALRGHALDAASLARKCDVEKSEIDALMGGHAEPSLLTKAAECLDLHADAIRLHRNYKPQVPHLQGVVRLSLPFEEDTVNAWLIRDEDQTLLFDTGFDRDSACALLQSTGIAPLDLFITHDHRDHVGGISGLRPLIKKHHEMPYGQSLRLGALEISCFDLSGHCIPTYGYQIRGLSRLICVVGDALFAGSIGGCQDSFTYQMALRNLRHHVMSLPDDTILLTGHGPATTVGQEKRHNPFLAGGV